MKIPYSSDRFGRWAWRYLMVLIGLYALYLVAGNVFINTPLGEHTVNRKPEKFRMAWNSGYTLWPGHVSLSDVQLKGHVRRTQWEVQAQSAEGRIALLPLLGKEFRMPQVSAHGVTGGARRVQADIPPPPSGPGGWTLRFDSIVSDSVLRGYFEDLVLEGKGSAKFGFVKQTRGGPMEVLPSSATFTAARLSRTGKEWLTDTAIGAKFAIAEHRREEAAGLQKLRLTDAELTLDGVSMGLDVAMQEDGKLIMSTIPGVGQAHAKLGFARGQWVPGSEARWNMPLTSTDAKGVKHRDALDASLSVDQDLHLRAVVPAQAMGVLGLDANLSVKGNTLLMDNFKTLLPRTSGHVKGQWRFSSLRWLSNFMPETPWLTLEGAGDVAADLQIVDGKVVAGSSFSVPDVALVAEVMGNRIEGNARAVGKLGSGPKGELLPTLDILMRRFSIAANSNPTASYVQGRDLRLNLRSGADLAKLKDSVQAHLTFSNAAVPDLRVYNRYLPTNHLSFEGGSGTLSGDLRLDTAGDIGSGWIRVVGRDARMRMAGIALRGDVNINTQLRRADIARRSFAVDGSTIKLDNISFSEPGGESRSGWWTRINLQRGSMDWNKPLSVRGNADVTMKDVGFLLSLFSRQREYPKWVYKLIDSGQAQVNGKIRWDRDTLMLEDIDASNNRFDLLAQLRLRGLDRRGKLFAKWGVLSVGVEVDGPNNKFHVLRAREWYDSQEK